ncbi:MAG: hypothetical protein HN742_03985 [Lentisphaerae bacterium]|jgi:hypothetical protein|nr:hypothetical protein [Lentisphaerota bacterium]MBT4822763.1 hypothetical protein [Lentisphaerota bacterium]MBT5604875.1 hypothetical protein [Lentisphaerota bacterium]MBT7054206.1 hypothetical protein [Lentisphaerota bacterium]MBT7841003.1 hypothetical protein [Lentisphaerota bacterium]
MAPPKYHPASTLLRGIVLLIMLSVLGIPLSGRCASIWIEGEDASSKGNTPHPWWYDKVKAEVLSNGQWLSHFSKKKEGTAGYEVTVSDTGDYVLWVRANPVKSALSYRVNGKGWQAVGFGPNAVRGRMNIAADNKPDLRFIAWVRVGKLTLPAGKHQLEFRFHSGTENHGAIDCLCLTNDGFVPSGAVKPGQRAGATRKITAASPADAIWIEGEEAAHSTVTRHPWWYDQVKKDVLSGNDWISNYHKEKSGVVEYVFNVVESDTFTFWIRANPLRSRISFQLDEKQWQPIDLGKEQRGRMNIAADNKPDMRYIAWSKVGKVQLSQGPHTIRFRLDSKLLNHGAIDCFTFVRIPFVPSGATKPSIVDEAAIGPGDWFPVIGDVDPFSDKSVVDVSHLVEAPAGKHGFLRADGRHLRFANSDKPVKFWAVNGGPGGLETPEAMELAARWYRKHGINLVRQHTVVASVGLLRSDGTLDPDRLDRYDRWFATLKKHGIYSTWSVIYPHHGAILRKSDGLDAKRFAELDAFDKHRDGNKQAIVVNDLVNLDRDLQDIMLRYFKVLLEHRNPHTGLVYKDDPALAVVEFQNESNAFFHTLNGLRGKDFPIYSRMLRRGFFTFVSKKYGSKNAVAKAWNSRWDGNDKWEEGELGLMAPFHWGTDGPQYEFKGHVRRCGDYIEFLTKIQRGYYARRQKELRRLGFRAVTVTTAWQGVGSSSLANLYCDSAADMVDRHNYFAGGEGRHSIIEGKVNNETHLNQPGRGLLNLGLFQTADQPFGVSEWSMMPPAPCKAEAAPLYAFYGLGLQGWDASYHFACSGHRLGDGWPGLSKYTSHTPHYMGQFPALAFAVHNGHVKEGAPVAIRNVGDRELYAGRDVLGQSIAHGSHDEKALGSNVTTPPEYLAIGRVALAFTKGDSRTADVSSYWDKKKEVLTSNTKQLRWHYGDRFVEVRTPKTQAVIGFVGGKSPRLPDVRLTVKTPFVSLIFTPLDNADLADSKHILITAMARDKQTGSEYNADWTHLKTVGGPPLLMEPVQAKILFRGPKPTAVNALDVYGVPTGKQVKLSADGTFAINGRYQTYYYEVVR